MRLTRLVGAVLSPICAGALLARGFAACTATDKARMQGATEAAQSPVPTQVCCGSGLRQLPHRGCQDP